MTGAYPCRDPQRGVGGLELSSRLSTELADEVDVTLMGQGDSFIFGFSKLDVIFARRTMDEVRILYRDITEPGVTFRQEPVLSIDPERKRVVTNPGVYDADVLVTPGPEDCGDEFYSPDGAARVRDLHRPQFHLAVSRSSRRQAPLRRFSSSLVRSGPSVSRQIARPNALLQPN